MRRSLSEKTLMVLLGLWVFAFSGPVACSCGNSGAEEADGGGDDDGVPVMDDDGIPGDDDLHDDDIDDDADDDSDDDTVDPYCARGFVTPDGGCIIQLAGGTPGHDGVAVDAGADGTVYVAAAKGREIVVYSKSTVDSQQSTEDDGYPPLNWETESGWQAEIVDHMGGDPDLVVDEDGYLHLAYTDLFDNGIRYATNASGTWEREIVATQERVTRRDLTNYPALAIDSDGAAHIAYTRERPVGGDFIGQVRYATNESGTWEDRLAWGVGDVGMFNAIALGPSGEVYIAFNSLPVGYADTYVISNRAGSFALEFYRPWSVHGNGLAVDAGGAIHIALLTFTAIEYGVKEPEGDWHFENAVDSPWTVGHSMALASDAKAHIAYGAFDDLIGTYGEISYTTNESGLWPMSLTLTAEAIGADVPTDTAVGPDHSIHIAALHTNGSDRLRVLTRESAAWKDGFLDGASSPGGHSLVAGGPGEAFVLWDMNGTGLVFDQITDGRVERTVLRDDAENVLVSDRALARVGDTVHAAYIDTSADSVVYGTYDSGTWSWTFLDTGINDLTRVRLAADPEGIAHIVFQATEDFHTYYMNSSNNGLSEYLGNNVGRYDVAADVMGMAHIINLSLTRPSDDELVDMTNASGNWESTTIRLIDHSGYIADPSTVRAPDGTIRVSYRIAGPGSPAGGTLFYAVLENGSWASGQIDTTEIAETYEPFDNTCLTVLQNGSSVVVFSIVHSDIGYRTAKLTQTENGWSSEILEQFHMESPTCGADASDFVHMAYEFGSPLAYRFLR
ncbi:MAG: hypothetical protein M5R36_29000 [Deltaproteobacteria bacterium]|nr:hypothetical protein [Deltaproteobacteria bacterium]